MAKRIQVGGRIESKEVGGIVTGAAEILDDAKGKKQSVINGETDDELLRLDQSKQDNLTFDNAPTEGSDNPVKSGGVYAADKALSDAIEAILLLIPSASSALNKLVDTAMMNSSISTATATFKGTYNVVTDLSLTVDATHEQIAAALGNVISTADNNDYAFVQVPVSAESMDIRRTERYKFNGTAWGYEYDLNTSGFTAAQWAAINSGITIALVGKLIGLPTSSELQALLGQKQNTLTFDNVPTAGSANPVKSGGVHTAINDEKMAREQLGQTVTGIDGRVGNVEEVIPTGAAANNKLVANNSMEAYVTSIIEAITASFTIATADGHINLTLTQTNGRVASLTLTSSDIASAQALTALTGRVSTAESNITSLGGRVSTNETDIANLQQLYNDLQQSKPEPVTALPETGQQQGVIYRLAGTTSYSDYMWNGSTWVLMATYNNAIDPRPKKASQNLVTSGGVFDNMGALDVSELNATENPHILAQYVDLSAALVAIPTDYQKGGMSIKFVQSSDNKYLQFRYMSTSTAAADFTNVANWQGIDDAPTAGSDNLVKSGGVDQKLFDLGSKTASKENFQNIEKITTFSDWTEISGKAVSASDGSLVNAGASSVVINLSDKDWAKIKFPISAFGGNYGYGFFTSDGQWHGVHTIENTEITVDIPYNATEFRCSWTRRGQYFQSITLDVVNAIEVKTKTLNDTALRITQTAPLMNSSVFNDWTEQRGAINADDGSVVQANAAYTIINLVGKNWISIAFRCSAFGGNYGYGYFTSDNVWHGVRTSVAQDVVLSLPYNATEFRMTYNVLPTFTVSSLDKIDGKSSKIQFPFHPTWDLTKVGTQQVVDITQPATISSLYQLYDELVTLYPNWVTKIDCSEAETPLGITAPEYLDGLPIYMYKFSPKRTNTSADTKDRIKVMITSGVHSNENMGMYILNRFFRMLCDNFAADETASQLRTLIDFYVIPCVNPWGFVHNNLPPYPEYAPVPGRQNGNGVNLNRNFPTKNWVKSGAPTDTNGNYTGETAGSEYETKIVMYYAEQIMPDVFFDVHTGGMTGTGAYGSSEIDSSISDENLSLFLGMGRTIINCWMNENSDFPSDPEDAASIFNVNLVNTAGELHRWAYETITPISVLTEESVENKWSNGVLGTLREFNTARIWRENLQSVYNTITYIVDAACKRKF